MSRFFACDSCKEHGEARDTDRLPAMWFMLERDDYLSSYGELPGPFHLCSWACVMAYASRQCSPSPKLLRPVCRPSEGCENCDDRRAALDDSGGPF